MPSTQQPEVWLRGPLPHIPPLLQPVAHALLQAREELTILLHAFPGDLLWQRPAGVASPGFHLRHLVGVLDRLLTYAQGKTLSEEQMAFLQNEGKEQGGISTHDLLADFGRQVDQALAQMEQMDETKLTEVRLVGRAQLPSTVLGLLFHAAEHTMRHLGQLLVTVKVLRDQEQEGKD